MDEDLGYEEVDYTPLHLWTQKYGTAGTMFGPSDVETIWELEWEEELGIPFKNVWAEMKHSYEWRHMADRLSEVGYEIISLMCEAYVQEKGLRG
jgi:hypothetical protein